MKKIKIHQMFLCCCWLTLVACVDEAKQVMPLSNDSLVTIPSESNEGSILESSTEPFRVPVVVSSELEGQGIIQLGLSSVDGAVHGVDYTTSPDPDENGIISLTSVAGAKEAALLVTPILDPEFNPNKVVVIELLGVGDGLIIGPSTHYSLTIVNQPIIEVSTVELGFGAIESGSAPVLSYTVSGLGLLGDMEISAESGFLVSLDNSVYQQTVVLAPEVAEQNEVTVFVQFNANTGNLGTKTGTLSHITEEGETVSVNVTGKEVVFSDFVFSSFENVDITGLSVEYTKSGTEFLDNNAGEAPVDFVATGSELGFDSSFDVNDIGDDGGEPIGVGGITNLFELNDEVGSIPFVYNSGSQGYHASDLDGTLEVVFDEVTFATDVQHLEFSMAIYLYSFEGNFDGGEGVELLWRTSSGDTPLIDVEDVGGNGAFTVNGGVSFDLEQWTTLSAGLDVSEAGFTGRIVVRINNDNNDDVYIIDDISLRVSE